MELHEGRDRRLTHGSRMRSTVVGILLSFLSLPLTVQAQAADDARATLRGLSKAFTQVAKTAAPAVVFIQVEQRATDDQTSFELNNPFELFSPEFFERFFRHRFPEQNPQRRRQQGQGSGFLITPEGHILTNHHVIGEADRITVRFDNGRELPATLIGSDPKSDVAVIKVEGQAFPVLPTGNSDALEVGEWVVAVGNPFGLTHTTTAGIVSAKGRSRVGIVDYEDFIQTDAAINPGNSGGPLLNLAGEVVGMNTAIFSENGGYSGIGFAIPMNMATRIQQQLVSTGKVSRGYLGVQIQELTDDLAQSFGLDKTDGVLVAGVGAGTPAEKTGLKTGDVILAINDTPVKETGQFRNRVASIATGEQITLRVVRGKQPLDILVTVEELPEDSTAAPALSLVLEQLGFTIQELTPEVAAQLGYTSQPGAVVAAVVADSPAERAGLRPGMIIQQVNQKAVHTALECFRIVMALKPRERLLLLVQDGQTARFVAFPLG